MFIGCSGWFAFDTLARCRLVGADPFDCKVREPLNRMCEGLMSLGARFRVRIVLACCPVLANGRAPAVRQFFPDVGRGTTGESKDYSRTIYLAWHRVDILM